MAKQIILLGGGGHGKVVLETLLGSGSMVAGILDSRMSAGAQVFGIPVLGGDEYLDTRAVSDVLLVNGLGANPNIGRRKHLFESMKRKGFEFQSVKHISAVIGRECDFAEGHEVMAGAVLQNRVRVGANAVVNTRASIDHDCILGAHSFVSPGAVLCGDAKIAEAVFIGAGAVVLPGVQIGAHAIVGAGAVVTKDVPGGCIVAGNPAVKIGMNTQ